MFKTFLWLISHNLKKYMFFLFLFICVSISANVFAGWDLLDKAFQPSIEQNWLVDLGSTKDQVGNEILRESTNVNISLSSWITTTQRSPLIVRIAKLLLRLTIVLAVTMVLYNGVLYIIQSSKWEAPKDPQKNLLNIWIWILLALSSLWIINLVNSITVSSLKTSEDLWWLTVWCQTGWSIIAWNTLKERICLHSLFWHPQETLQYREFNANRIINVCKIRNTVGGSDERKPITQWEMESKCVEDMWWIVVK